MIGNEKENRKLHAGCWCCDDFIENWDARRETKISGRAIEQLNVDDDDDDVADQSENI